MSGPAPTFLYKSCRLLVEGIAPMNAEFHSAAARSANAFLIRTQCLVSRHGGGKTLPHLFPFRNSGNGRNSAGNTPQDTVATVASVTLYSITSDECASTTM